jgi:hypothetical protein
LALHFNEQKGEIFGDEVITLQPLGAHFRMFYLDSSELNIDSVTLERGDTTSLVLSHTLQQSRLWITLDRDYDETSTLKIHVAYRGFPRTGLYFVNPTHDYPDAPQEVYSQGEAEFNHYWFPCWDYPNDMATSETLSAKARSLIPHHPGWYWFVPCFDAYRKGEYQPSLDFVRKVNMPGFWRTQLAIAANCGQLGEQPAACNALKALLAQKPQIANLPREELAIWWQPELVEHLIIGLRKAGLEM